MRYESSLEWGVDMLVENVEEQTEIALSSSSGGQQQSQRQGYVTGKWTKPPLLYKSKRGPVLEVTTNRGAFHFRVSPTGIVALREVPVLQDSIPLQKAKAAGSAQRQLPPMPGMKPMESMPPMAPMTMSMGDMHMSMGAPRGPVSPKQLSVDSGKRFCTECGREAASGDKFCAGCGKRL